MAHVTATGTAQTIPDRAAIRADLEATRNAYDTLLGSLSEDDWKRKSANAAWRVGQLMWHTAWAAGYFPGSVDRCRKGKGMNPPMWLANPMNTVITRIGSRGATPKSVRAKYDAAHAALLECLDGVRDNDWQNGVKSFGSYNTVESTFHAVSEHFKEH